MPTTERETFQPGSKAILLSDPFDGRYGDQTGASVTITRYGGFEDITFQVEGLNHVSTCTDDQNLLACDEDGRPLAANAERHFQRFDRREQQLRSRLATLDAERETFRQLVTGALG
jgi:hypothetical protein